MFVSQFKWLVWTLSGTSCSDATMTRRCMGWASTVVMRFIWELDMAEWLGSRTQLKHLWCSSSRITAGPNKTLSSRRTHKQTSCSNTVPHTPCQWGLSSETFGAALPVRSVTLVCGSVAVGCIKTKNVSVLLKHVIQQAHTTVPTLSCKRDDMLLKPCRGFQSFTIIYSLFASVPTQWISILVSLRAFKQKKICSKCKFRIYATNNYADIQYTDSTPPIWYISLIIYTVHYFLTYYYIIFCVWHANMFSHIGHNKDFASFAGKGDIIVYYILKMHCVFVFINIFLWNS